MVKLTLFYRKACREGEMLKAQVDTMGIPFWLSSKSIVGCTSNPDGGTLLHPVRNTITSSSVGQDPSSWSEKDNKNERIYNYAQVFGHSCMSLFHWTGLH